MRQTGHANAKGKPVVQHYSTMLKTREEMSCYLMIDIYIDESKGRGSYDDYIEKVKPIVERFGSEYLVRSEKVTALSLLRNPAREIIPMESVHLKRRTDPCSFQSVPTLSQHLVRFVSLIFS